MRTIHTLLAASALVLLAACGTDPSSPVAPPNHTLRDGASFGGSGNFTTTTSDSDTTTTGRGAGWGGSNN